MPAEKNPCVAFKIYTNPCNTHQVHKEKDTVVMFSINQQG